MPDFTISSPPKMPVRYGMTLRVRPEHFEEYRRQHAAVWPEVLAMISACHIRDYTIYHRDGVLFSHFAYWGADFAADMERMAADPATRRWWDLMEPMQEPYPDRAPGEWWSRMEEVFHHD
jgi:L-rhamnose mutarotase